MCVCVTHTHTHGGNCGLLIDVAKAGVISHHPRVGVIEQRLEACHPQLLEAQLRVAEAEGGLCEQLVESKLQQQQVLTRQLPANKQDVTGCGKKDRFAHCSLRSLRAATRGVFGSL